MLSPQFNIGPLILHIYGLIIAIAILIGWIITKRRASLYKISPALFDDPLLLLPFIFGIIGGRLYHVIDKWALYASDPIKIFKVWEGGLGIFGALAGIVIGLWIFAKAKKINFLQLLDLTAPSLILGQAIGRIGNYINQEGYSSAANLPPGVYFYEAILETIAFIVLIALSKRLKNPGQIFGLYLILYSLSRSVAEIWRIDTAKLGDLKVAYILALLMVIIGSYLLNRSKQLNN